MRILYLFLLIVGAVLPAHSRAAPGPVLLVVSGYGVEGDKSRPGFEMDELAQAWVILRANGVAVEIASPQGGKVVAARHDAAKPYNVAFLADAQAVATLDATLPFAGAATRDYAAVYVMGGKGAMFDLHDNAALQALIARVWQAGGVVGAVCHGPAALVRVTLPDGTPLLAGRQATGFSDEEEQAFGKEISKRFAFQLEAEMRRVGARFTEAELMLPHVAVDGRLVTGQNPYATPATTEALLRAMGRVPVARTPWADERSMALLASLTPATAAAATKALGATPADYDAPLVAAWGHLRAMSAANATELQRGITAMEVAQPHYREPQLDEALAKARAKLASFGG